MLIGTSHIAKQSIKEVENAIKSLNPGVIALELDKTRFIALTNKKHSLSLKGLSPTEAIIVLIGYYTEKLLGKAVGTTPGDEMKKAIELAKKEDIKIMLIDQNIRVTLKKLKDALTFKEKMRFIKDILTSPFQRHPSIDLNKVPPEEVIHQLLTATKKRYPNVYKVLVEERNQIMAKNLNRVIQDYPDQKVIAIVGAGHEKAIIDLIKHENR